MATVSLWLRSCALVSLVLPLCVAACAMRPATDPAAQALPAKQGAQAAGTQSPFAFKKRSEREASAAIAAAKSTPAKPSDVNPLFSGNSEQPGWSILVMTFQGEGAQTAARQAVAQFEVQTGLSGARAEPSQSTPGAWALLQGAYASATDPKAKSDLAVVRQIAPGAILVPPANTASGGTLPDYDLSTLIQRLGRGRGALWTLQVAYYGHPDRATPTDKELAQFRDAAEKAVIELRAQGEEAFYYHSPRGSSVTVGVFDDSDQVTAVKDPVTGKMKQLPRPRESMRLLEARRMHPLNLVNGAPILVKNKGANESREQESFLVRVPGS